MSIKGSSYSWFRKCLARGDLAGVRAAAADLPSVDLTDALRVCVLMAQQGDRRYERAAVRWLARLSLEARPSLEDLHAGLVAMEALPLNPAGARQELATLCGRLGVAGP
jgi:hypothetical protein